MDSTIKYLIESHELKKTRKHELKMARAQRGGWDPDGIKFCSFITAIATAMLCLVAVGSYADKVRAQCVMEQSK